MRKSANLYQGSSVKLQVEQSIHNTPINTFNMIYVNNRGISSEKYELLPLSSSKINTAYANTMQNKPFLNR
jgi:hypothetical protein